MLLPACIVTAFGTARRAELVVSVTEVAVDTAFERLIWHVEVSLDRSAEGAQTREETTAAAVRLMAAVFD